MHSLVFYLPVYEVHQVCTGMGHVGQRYVEKVHLLNYFVLKFHVLLNFEPIYSRLSIHSIITSTCENI